MLRIRIGLWLGCSIVLRQSLRLAFRRATSLYTREALGAVPIGTLNNSFLYFTNSQNRSIWSAMVCNAARQKFLSVRSMPATLAVSSAVATVVV